MMNHLGQQAAVRQDAIMHPPGGVVASMAAPPAPLDACATKDTIMERVLHVSITNSLGNLALAGPHGGCWRLVDG